MTGFIGKDPKMLWKNFFNLADTDVPMYNNMLKNADYFANNKNISSSIEVMSPWDYMRKIAEQRVPPSTVERELSAVDQNLVKKYAERARGGEISMGKSRRQTQSNGS